MIPQVISTTAFLKFNNIEELVYLLYDGRKIDVKTRYDVILDDLFSIEELSYRFRIFVFSSVLDKIEVKKILMRYNVDAFVTNVIDFTEFKRISKIVNSPTWFFVTASKTEYDLSTINGGKSYLIPLHYRSLMEYVNSTSKHKIEEGLYYSPRCT
ncbi:hypothetical protein [Acidianus sp. HS-5]|uniref:hypothetical protein n=1 Tax=Acidianus sp. HS-5 TaxID=2886040 RepID=UPI001F15D7E6|nr:hypothetical protein [Acidianus sp. HS-5]BDC17270.1 hypothetical protein HS5_01600 [Acidianus sp. HS-5]